MVVAGQLPLASGAEPSGHVCTVVVVDDYDDDPVGIIMSP
jgi:hypothetical protein